MTSAASQRLFVGRHEELGQIEAAVAGAIAGRGNLVLVSGEAGIGKTRTADEIAARAPSAGAGVLVGRCFDDAGMPPFWPWVQVLRSYTAAAEASSLRAVLGNRAGVIAEILPEVAMRLGEVDVPPAIDPLSARFRLFDAVGTMLRAACRERPHVIIIDDLQWADVASLLLLQFLVRQLGDLYLLIVATQRDEDIDPNESRAKLIAEITTAPVSCRIALRGLSEVDCRSLVTALVGAGAASEISSWVQKETAGNPLFVTEVLRDLSERGVLGGGEDARLHSPPAAQIRVPESVRPIIAARLRRLDQETKGALDVAAVIGRELDSSLVARVLGSEKESVAVVAALRRAVDAGVLQATPTLGRFRFAHPLIREALYDSLNGERRVRLHEQVARALEALSQRGGRLYVDELAHHFYEAALGGCAAEASEYARLAGEHAMSVSAYEKAASHFDRALQALDLLDTSQAQRGAALIALVQAEFLSGNSERADEHCRLAMELARQLGDGILFARAVFHYRGVWGVAGVADPGYVELVAEALQRMPGEDSELRVQLMGRLATELYWSGQQERRELIARDMLAMARRINTSAAIARALSAGHFALWRPDNASERLQLANELVELVRGLGDEAATAGGLVWRVIDLVELGRTSQAALDIEAYSVIAARLHSPYFDWQAGVLQTLRALIEGRLADAERLAGAAYSTGSATMGANADMFFGVAMLQLRWLQGRLEELEQGARAFVAEYTAMPAWRAALAFIYSEQEREQDAWREFEILAADDFAALPRDANLLIGTALLAEVCAFLDDSDRARRLYAMLEPYAEHVVVVGNGAACFGSVAYYLGRLSAVLGRFDDARRHFEDALATHLRMGARALLAVTQYAYAEMLLDAGIPFGPPSEAATLLVEALVGARAMGMARLQQEIERLQEHHAPRVPSFAGEVTPGTPASAAARSHAVAHKVFRREGDYWDIGRSDAAFRLRDSKGLAYIANLLRHPGREFLASDLVAAAEPAAGGGLAERRGCDASLAVAADLGDAGEMIDAAARADYTRRLGDLREELREAEEFNDIGHAEKARAEIDAISRELARAVGLGGRGRKAASHSERARINVTRAIKTALESIGRNDPAIERYLAATIRTGTFCSYQPDPDRPIRWEL